MNRVGVHNGGGGERGAGGARADVLWGSAMDLQMKLAAEGYAAAYESREARSLPQWAVWRHEAYGTTYEPVVIVYNRRLVGEDEVPRSHADVLRLLREKADKYRCKLVSYDVEKSGIGYLLVTHDAKYNADFWELARTLGAS